MKEAAQKIVDEFELMDILVLTMDDYMYYQTEIMLYIAAKAYLQRNS